MRLHGQKCSPFSCPLLKNGFSMEIHNFSVLRCSTCSSPFSTSQQCSLCAATSSPVTTTTTMQQLLTVLLVGFWLSHHAVLAFRMPTRRLSMPVTALNTAMIFNFEYEHMPGHPTKATDNLTGLVDTMTDDADAFIVFYAQWCPDCESVPSILQGLENANVVSIVMCNIGDEKDLWRSGEHMYKQAPLSLKGIPTLVRWNKKEIARLERGLSDGSMYKQGGDAFVQEQVALFVQDS